MDQYEPRTLDWRAVDYVTTISAKVLSGMTEPEERFFKEQLRNQMIYGLRSHVLSYPLPGHIAKREHTVIWRVPATSWQMFKEEHQHAWWMRWLVARRPVLKTAHTRRVEFEAEWKDYAVYPWQDVAPTHARLGESLRQVDIVVKVSETPVTPDAPTGA